MDSTWFDHGMVDERDVVDDIFEVKLVGLTGDSLATLGNLTASMLGQELIEKSCQSLPSKQGQMFLGGKVHGLRKLGEWNVVDDVGGVIWMFLQQVSSVQEFGGQSKSSPVDIHLASFLCGSRLLSFLQGFIWANSWIDLHQLLPTCTSARNAISQAAKEYERMIVRIHEGFFHRWYTYYSWWCSTWYGKNTGIFWDVEQMAALTRASSDTRWCAWIVSVMFLRSAKIVWGSFCQHNKWVNDQNFFDLIDGPILPESLWNPCIPVSCWEGWKKAIYWNQVPHWLCTMDQCQLYSLRLFNNRAFIGKQLWLQLDRSNIATEVWRVTFCFLLARVCF